MTKHYQKIEKEVDERTFTSISQLLTSLRRLNPRGHRLFSDPRRENRNDKTTTFILIGLWITALQPQVLSRSKISFFVLGILKPYHVISLSLSLARRYMREYLEVNADSMYCFFCQMETWPGVSNQLLDLPSSYTNKYNRDQMGEEQNAN